MSPALRVIVAMATLLAADAFFLPDCLWDVDSWDIPDRNPVSHRFRRFLWDDSDVCDWMCDPDLLPHEICNICCRRSATTPRPVTNNAPMPQSMTGGSTQIGSSNRDSNAHPSSGMTGEQSELPQSNAPFQVQLPVPQETSLTQAEVQKPQVGFSNNQNSPQSFHQNQNWPPQSSQQNQNWLQGFQQQNPNWQQPQPNQYWPQSLQQNQNWQQPLQQNQNWFQPPLQSLDGVGNRIPFNQDTFSQTLTQGFSISPSDNEPLNVQVPINLAGLFQAQVPSRLTPLLQAQPPAQNGQIQGFQSSIQVPVPQNPSINGNGGLNGQGQQITAPAPAQSQQSQTSSASGNGGPGVVQGFVNWVTQPFTQPGNGQGNQQQTQQPPAQTQQTPAQTQQPPAQTQQPPAQTQQPPAQTQQPPAQTQQGLLTSGQQQVQSGAGPQQQFQTAPGQPTLPAPQAPQDQNQQDAQPVQSTNRNGNGEQ